MTVRGVLKSFVGLLLIAAAVGAVAAYRFWSASDELLRRSVLERLAESAPGWQVAIGRARFDWNRHVRLYDVRLQPADQPHALLEAPEIIVHLDRESLAERQEVLIHKIHLREPTLHLVRLASGEWNIQTLPPVARSQLSLPELRVEGGLVRVHTAGLGGAFVTRLSIGPAHLRLIPAGRSRFLVQGQAEAQSAGLVAAEGEFDLHAQTWDIHGNWSRGTLGPELIGLVSGLSPEWDARLAEAAARVQSVGSSALGARSAPEPARPFRVASLAGAQPPDTSPRPLPDFGVSGALAIQFHTSRTAADAQARLQISGELQHGEVTHAALPFPLRDVAARLFWDRDRLVVEKLSGKNGLTEVHLAGQWQRQGAGMPGTARLKVTGLPLDEHLRARLPERLQTLYDSVQPGGIVAVECTLNSDGNGAWQVEGLAIAVREGSARHEKFPYPIRSITGTLRQHDGVWRINFNGLAGAKRVDLAGWSRHWTDGETVLDIQADGIPVDETLLTACPAEAREALISLALRGAVNISARLHRPEGPEQRFRLDLAAVLPGNSLTYERFPYRMERLTGSVTYSSEDRTWWFRDLKAVHDEAVLAGSGSFTLRTEPPFHGAAGHPAGSGRLTLLISAKGARFDRDLQRALSKDLQELWDELRPSGRFDVLTSIDWIRGGSVQVALPEVVLYDAAMLPQVFPYPFEKISARLSYAGGRADVAAFSAAHAETAFRAKGVVEALPAGGWHVRMDEVLAERLFPDREFRRALPPDLRAAVEALDPQGPLRVSGGMDLRSSGKPAEPVVAAWDLAVDLAEDTLQAGVELRQVSGRVTGRGRFDGKRVENHGAIDLERLTVLGHEIARVQGPYRLADRELTVGTSEALEPAAVPKRIDAERRLVGRAIGGWLTLDAVALLGAEPAYRALVTISQGNLEEYARRYLNGTRNVRGVMNGWVDLHGRGVSAEGLAGRGQLQISPAALYELPVMLQVFNVLTFVPPDKSAFNYALLDFTIARRQFRFEPIDLVGDALRLRGRGTTGFDGTLDLQFYSMLARNQLPIPLIKPFLDEATKGWVGVEVHGTVEAPVAQVRPVPVLDDTLKRFLTAFEPPPGTHLPRTVIPPLGPAPSLRLPRPPPRVERPR